MVHYRILFIVNPISGFGLGWEIPYRIRHIAAYKHIEYNIRFTEYAGHAKEIVEQAKHQNYTHIIAAGGDGTVNEIGTALINMIPTLTGLLLCFLVANGARLLGLA